LGVCVCMCVFVECFVEVNLCLSTTVVFMLLGVFFAGNTIKTYIYGIYVFFISLCFWCGQKGTGGTLLAAHFLVWPLFLVTLFSGCDNKKHTNTHRIRMLDGTHGSVECKQEVKQKYLAFNNINAI
jgi:hypothetical protein